MPPKLAQAETRSASLSCVTFNFRLRKGDPVLRLYKISTLPNARAESASCPAPPTTTYPSVPLQLTPQPQETRPIPFLSSLTLSKVHAAPAEAATVPSTPPASAQDLLDEVDEPARRDSNVRAFRGWSPTHAGLLESLARGQEARVRIRIERTSSSATCPCSVRSGRNGRGSSPRAALRRRADRPSKPTSSRQA